MSPTAREEAMRFLYGYDMNQDESAPPVALEEDRPLDDEGKAYLAEVQKLAPKKLGRVDEIVQANLFNWKLSRLSKVDLAILRLAVLEMEYMERSTPPKVLITEMMKIADKYSGQRAKRFVNGVLAGYMEQKGIEGFHVDRTDQIRREKEAEEEEQRRLREQEEALKRAKAEPQLESLGVSLDDLESGSAPRKDARPPRKGEGKTASAPGRPHRAGPGAAGGRPRPGLRQTGRGAASKPHGHKAGGPKGRGGGRQTGPSRQGGPRKPSAPDRSE